MSSSRKKSRDRAGTPKVKPPPSTPAASFSYAQIAAGTTPAPKSPEEATTDDENLNLSSPGLAPDDADTARLFEEALDDVHTRFILNLPPDELATSDRIFFQLEQAWWFYDDFVCDAEDEQEDQNGDAPKLPRFKNLYTFAKKMFTISPLLRPMKPNFSDMWTEFAAYRRSISTYGTIFVSAECDKVVLCQDWSSKAWTFPAGKVNQNEVGIDAAARETYEETGFDPNCLQGRTRTMSETALINGVKLPWRELREEDALVYVEDGSKKRRTCYVCLGVPETFEFEPVARKEVSAVGWHDITDLPKKSFAVFPFMSQLKRWIRRNQKKQQKDEKRRGNRSRGKDRSDSVGAFPPTPKRERGDKKNRDKSRDKSRGSKGSSRPNSRAGSRGRNAGGAVKEGDDLARAGLASPGDDKRWTAEEMFATNERLTGKTVDYDGNPHVFALEGFRGNDPHAFRVVGGGFMNSGDKEIAAAPRKEQLQPLVRPAEGGDGGIEGDFIPLRGVGGEGELTPFFSDGGATPWGDVVQEALEEQAATDAAVAAASTATDTATGDRKKNRSRKKKRGGGTDGGEKTPRRSPSPVSKVLANASNDKGMAILSMLRGKSGGDAEGGEEGGEGGGAAAVPATGDGWAAADDLGMFLTDAEITARSQKEKGGAVAASDARAEEDASAPSDEDRGVDGAEGGGGRRSAVEGKEDEHLQYLRAWVRGLPQTPPTPLFGDFRLDADAVMEACLAVQ